jgi:hypothetical protein
MKEGAKLIGWECLKSNRSWLNSLRDKPLLGELFKREIDGSSFHAKGLGERACRECPARNEQLKNAPLTFGKAEPL